MTPAPPDQPVTQHLLSTEESDARSPDMPAEMVMVPREPTDAMIAAGKAYHPMAIAIWAVMVVAAPRL